MATKYIDNRLTTGNNDGTSAENAWRSLLAAQLGTISAGDVVEVAAGSGPYYEATNVNANLRVNATDISFDAASRQIRTAGAVSFSAYNTAGQIIRVFGSALNDGQYTVASASATAITLSATNTLRDEAAGARVRVTDITAANASGNRPFVFDQGRNGSNGNPIIWNFNGCEISAGWPLTNGAHKWVRSAANPNEWYALRADGSNPSLNKPESAVVNGHFMCASAGDADRNRGTVGALTFEGQYGYGDNDSLGFSTVYVRAPGDPVALRWSILVGQIHCVMYQNWGDHTFRNARFSFGCGNADGTANGACVLARGLRFRFERCVFMYADGHAFEANASGPHILDHCIGYWCGHRFLVTGATNMTVSAINCVDWGAHLFCLISTNADATTTVYIRGCISANNEAGAIDKKDADAVLRESHNLWYPRMTAAGGALGYISPANWAKTSPFDVPSYTATTESDQSVLENPLFQAVSDTDFDACNWRLKSGSRAIGRGQFNESTGAATTDYQGQTITKRYNIGVDQTQYVRPNILGNRA